MRRAKGLWICLAYGLLFLLMTLPLFFEFTTAVLGSGPDPYQYIWNADVFRSEMLAGSNPFHTDRLLYPEGVNLWMHTYTPIIGLINLPLNNPYLSVNLALLLSVAIGGYGAYRLAKDYLHSELLAFLCGFAFSLSPYITSHLLEHMHLILIAAVPFFIRALLKLFPDHRFSWTSWRQGPLITMVVCFALTFFSDYYSTFFLIFASVFYLLYILLQKWVSSWKTWVKWLAPLGLILIGHLAVEPMHISSADDRGAFYNTADAASIVIPAANSSLYQQEVFEQQRENLGFRGPNEQVMFMGFLLLVFFIVYLFQKGKSQSALLLFFTVIFFLLSIPKIKVGGMSVTYSPFAWFHYLPFLNNMRNPSRMVQMVYLFMPILAMWPIDKWVMRSGRKWVLVLIFAVVLLEYWPMTYPIIRKAEVPEYAQILAEAKGKSVLYLPFGVEDGLVGIGDFNTQHLQSQIEHQKNMLGAYVSRISEDQLNRIARHPVLSKFAAVADSFKRTTDPVVSYERLLPKAQLSAREVEDFMNTYQVGVVVFDNRLSRMEKKAYHHLLWSNFGQYVSKRVQLADAELYYLDAAL